MISNKLQCINNLITSRDKILFLNLSSFSYLWNQKLTYPDIACPFQSRWIYDQISRLSQTFLDNMLQRICIRSFRWFYLKLRPVHQNVRGLCWSSRQKPYDMPSSRQNLRHSQLMWPWIDIRWNNYSPLSMATSPHKLPISFSPDTHKFPCLLIQYPPS